MTHHQWPPWERGVHFNVMKMGIYRTAIRESLNGFPLSLSLGEPSVGHYALSAHLEGVPKVCWNIDIIRRGRTRPSNWGAVLPFSKFFSIDNDKLKKKSELPQLLGLGENKESIIDKRGIWTITPLCSDTSYSDIPMFWHPYVSSPLCSDTSCVFS